MSSQLADLEANVFVFLLATFLGFEVIRRVTPLLHTPLMSLTNAISGIAVVAAMVLTGAEHDRLSMTLGAIAVAASMTNVVGGFLITDRMLKMFRAPRARDGKGAKAAGAGGNGSSAAAPGTKPSR
jgi:NAD(P) transhydrogenase subunit alpha